MTTPAENRQKGADYTSQDLSLPLRHYSDAMFLRRELATGEIGGHRFEVSVLLSGAAVIFRFPDLHERGTWVLALEDLLPRVYDAITSSEAAPPPISRTSPPSKNVRADVPRDPQDQWPHNPGPVS